MRILRRIFLLMTICGCSRPSSWTSPSKKFLYNIYTVLVFLVMQTLVITLILDLVFNVDNQDDFSDNFYITLPMIVTCLKMCIMLFSRGNIKFLADTLEEEPFLPVDVDEIEIRTKFHKISEWNTMAYTIIIESCMIWMFVTSFLVEFENKNLTFRTWLPFNYSTPLLFSLAYGHQALSSTICTLSNVACDSLFSGLLIHIYCQFEILGHRLQTTQSDEIDSVKQCARHHSHIYKFAKMVNKEFKVIVCIQFLVSTMTVCFDLYRLTQTNLGSKTVEIMMYASCTLMQLYYYCWYGNEVKLKSLDVPKMAFESNWTSFNDSTKKILLMIMRRGMVPVDFSSIYLVSVNLETFKAILKSSYSAYTLLQQSQ